MAELELIPKIPVLAVQAGIFLANVGLIKKLFVEPYLRVRLEREQTTLGSRDEAVRLLAEAKEVTEEVDRKMSQGLKSIRDRREAIRKGALAKRQALIDLASDESKQWLAQADEQLANVVKQEKAKIPSTVKSLTEEVFKVTMSA